MGYCRSRYRVTQKKGESFTSSKSHNSVKKYEFSIEFIQYFEVVNDTPFVCVLRTVGGLGASCPPYCRRTWGELSPVL